MTEEVVRDPHGIAHCPRCRGEIAAGFSTCEGCGLEAVDHLPTDTERKLAEALEDLLENLVEHQEGSSYLASVQRPVVIAKAKEALQSVGRFPSFLPRIMRIQGKAAR